MRSLRPQPSAPRSAARASETNLDTFSGRCENSTSHPMPTTLPSASDSVTAAYSSATAPVTKQARNRASLMSQPSAADIPAAADSPSLISTRQPERRESISRSPTVLARSDPARHPAPLLRPYRHDPVILSDADGRHTSPHARRRIS